jgi:hypothetical protein
MRLRIVFVILDLNFYLFTNLNQQANQKKDTVGEGDDEDQLEPLTVEEQEEKEQLLEEGFSTWTRRDFNTFIRACEKYGRNDIKNISSEMEGKTEEEVQRYAKVFQERYKELNGIFCNLFSYCLYSLLMTYLMCS